MNRISASIAIIAFALTGNSAMASIDNVLITVNGTTGPVTIAPSSSVTATISADVTNGGATPLAWASTEWGFAGSPNTGCSEQPDPDVTPAAAATAPGTASISGMTAPTAEGSYPLIFTAYDGAGCTGGFIGLPAVTVTVAAVPPVVTQPQSVPALPLGGIIALGLGLLLVARRKLFR